jgi:hypothetical protein
LVRVPANTSDATCTTLTGAGLVRVPADTCGATCSAVAARGNIPRFAQGGVASQKADDERDGEAGHLRAPTSD